MKFDRRLLRGTLFIASVALLVSGGITRPQSAVAAPKGWSLPAGAREVAPDVWEIGSRDVNGRKLTGFAILDHGHGHEAKGGGKPGGGSTATGYAFISSGLKWKTFGETYVVDPTISNSSDDSMTADYIRGAVAYGIGQWEDAAGLGAVGDGNSVNVFGGETDGTVDRTKLGNDTNDVNEVCFDSIAQSGVIAVTFVWGYYYGPPATREIVEWDQIYDDDDFTWGDVSGTGNHALMDFKNIAVHEIGHAFGMDHPSNTFIYESMYAYATEGETIKQTLDVGDKAGINILY